MSTKRHATPADFANWREKAFHMDANELRYCAEDARRAAMAMRGHDPIAEGWYDDEASTYMTEMRRRVAGGKKRNPSLPLSRASARKPPKDYLFLLVDPQGGWHSGWSYREDASYEFRENRAHYPVGTKIMARSTWENLTKKRNPAASSSTSAQIRRIYAAWSTSDRMKSAGKHVVMITNDGLLPGTKQWDKLVLEMQTPQVLHMLESIAPFAKKRNPGGKRQRARGIREANWPQQGSQSKGAEWERQMRSAARLRLETAAGSPSSAKLWHAQTLVKAAATRPKLPNPAPVRLTHRKRVGGMNFYVVVERLPAGHWFWEVWSMGTGREQAMVYLNGADALDEAYGWAKADAFIARWVKDWQETARRQ